MKEIIFCDTKTATKRQRRAHAIYMCVMLAVLGACIGILSLFLASPYLGYSGNGMFLSYFKVPLIILFNLLPPILMIFFVYVVSGKAWISYLATGILFLGMSLGNYYKIRIRSDPFLASDILYLGEAGNIVSNYTLEITGRVVAVLLCFVIGLLFAIFFMRGKIRKKVLPRVVGAVLIAALSFGLYSTVYMSPNAYKAAANNDKINIWSDLQVFVSKGFVYPFIHSVQDIFPQKPDGYVEAQAIQTLSEYTDEGISTDKKVNVISVMLEAYSDLSVFDSLEFTEDVYGPLHEIQKESVSGHLISNVFAGGTIDTERAFLTGFTADDEYRRSVNSYIYNLREQGYYAEGLHAGDGWFYNRQNINRYMGFENYYFLEDYENGSRKDSFFFPELIRLYENRDKSVPYFNYSLTYQNHGAYDSENTVETAYIQKNGLSIPSYNILNNYLSGIYDTNRRMVEFLDYFRKIDEPVVIVMFGDHKPWLGDGNSVYEELGINLDMATEDGFYNYYSTPYFIWANDAAKKTLNCDFTGDGGDFSACFLMNKLFTLCSWGKNAYMQISDELFRTIDVVNTGSGYYRENGTLTTELSENGQQKWDAFRFVEYYWKNHFAYNRNT